MEDGEHQHFGAEGLLTHVGEDRDAETFQDEVDIKHAAKELQAEWRGQKKTKQNSISIQWVHL